MTSDQYGPTAPLAKTSTSALAAIGTWVPVNDSKAHSGSGGGMNTGSVATSSSVKAAMPSSGTAISSRVMAWGSGRIQEKSGAEPVY